ncbi:MAG: hypothetical protein QM770_23595 [Tepidisphaeraceae bacterium]
MSPDLRLLLELTAVPTAPFHEHRVMAFIDAFARVRRSLSISRDRFGNTLLVRKGSAGEKRPRLVYVAHLDHPGFIVAEQLDTKTIRCDFHGGVLAKLMLGAKVRFFDGANEVTGKVIDAKDDAGRASSATVRVSKPVKPGAFGMFDLTPGKIVGQRFHARVCDDLAGAASALATLDALAKSPAKCDVATLLTRGEEQGFIGAIASVNARPSLLRKTDRLISIECSAEQPVAKQGEGVVLRVGDRTSTFNSAFTRFIGDVGTDLAQKDKRFKFQRALMPGGTCEATVFDAWGYTTAAACVPLGNYHNMNKVRGRIEAENVHLGDWQNMVKLFLGLARRIHEFDGSHAALRDRLTKRFKSFEQLL